MHSSGGFRHDAATLHDVQISSEQPNFSQHHLSQHSRPASIDAQHDSMYEHQAQGTAGSTAPVRQHLQPVNGAATLASGPETSPHEDMVVDEANEMRHDTQHHAENVPPHSKPLLRPSQPVQKLEEGAEPMQAIHPSAPAHSPLDAKGVIGTPTANGSDPLAPTAAGHFADLGSNHPAGNQSDPEGTHSDPAGPCLSPAVTHFEQHHAAPHSQPGDSHSLSHHSHHTIAASAVTTYPAADPMHLEGGTPLDSAGPHSANSGNAHAAHMHHLQHDHASHDHHAAHHHAAGHHSSHGAHPLLGTHSGGGAHHEAGAQHHGMGAHSHEMRTHQHGLEHRHDGHHQLAPAHGSADHGHGHHAVGPVLENPGLAEFSRVLATFVRCNKLEVGRLIFGNAPLNGLVGSCISLRESG